MSTTQARLYSLSNAIERDRMVQPSREIPARQEVEVRVRPLPEHSPIRAWEPWVTIGIGLTVMMIAVFI